MFLLFVECNNKSNFWNKHNLKKISQYRAFVNASSYQIWQIDHAASALVCAILKDVGGMVLSRMVDTNNNGDTTRWSL